MIHLPSYTLTFNEEIKKLINLKHLAILNYKHKLEDGPIYYMNNIEVIRIATSYPFSLKRFKNKLKHIQIYRGNIREYG